ncbi:hypothetical protein [Deinococcus sp. PESE-13]
MTEDAFRRNARRGLRVFSSVMNRRGPGCGCLGCGGTTLLVLALLAFAAWTFVVKPARDFVAGWQTPSTQSTAARPPAPQGDVNAPLTQADVQRFVRVRRQVRSALGPSFGELQKVWQDVQSGQSPSLTQLLAVMRQTADHVGTARQAQQAALAKEGMSNERYAVVRAGVNRALGLPSFDLKKIAEGLQNGQLPDLDTSVKPATPEEKALVAPFDSELRASAAAGLLGL